MRMPDSLRDRAVPFHPVKRRGQLLQRASLFKNAVGQSTGQDRSQVHPAQQWGSKTIPHSPGFWLVRAYA